MAEGGNSLMDKPESNPTDSEELQMETKGDTQHSFKENVARARGHTRMSSTMSGRNKRRTLSKQGRPSRPRTMSVMFRRDSGLKAGNSLAHSSAAPSVMAVYAPEPDVECCECWKKIMKKCNVCCAPILLSEYCVPEKPTRWQEIRMGFLCPPHGKVGFILSLAVIAILAYGVLLSITGEHALPGGLFFNICILIVLSLIGGFIVELIKLPPLLGMLIVGCLLRNLPLDIDFTITTKWSTSLRNIALCVILLRAGLGLDPEALKKMSAGVFRLAFIPCFTEAIAEGFAARFLLGFPWIWSFMLGFVLAAVSPAVVVPSMISLTDLGYGVAKGIPTLVIAAASIDDVMAITSFGVLLGISFSEGHLVWTIFKGPLEAVIGVACGSFLGVIAWYLPPKDQTSKTLFQFAILLSAALFISFGGIALDLVGVGPLGVLSLAFVAALQWRKNLEDHEVMPVSTVFASLWTIFQPLLFGLIGMEIDLSQISADDIGLGIAVLIIGIFFRVIAAFCAVSHLNLTLKEKIFIPMAWLPKATVQAAIGSLAYDTAVQKNASDEDQKNAKTILTIAVLSIMITAPLGAALISLTAPRLLEKHLDNEENIDEAVRASKFLVGEEESNRMLATSSLGKRHRDVKAISNTMRLWAEQGYFNEDDDFNYELDSQSSAYLSPAGERASSPV